MPEIVLVTGINAAGKTTLVKEFPNHVRLNRDELGGKIAGLLPRIKQEVAAGRSVICDNTLPTIPDRQPFIDLAKELSVPIRCVHLDTTFEDAQLNACLRQIERRGELLMPDDFKKEKDPNLFPPVALFAYKKKFENKTEKGVRPVPEFPTAQYPKTAHGFNAVEIRPFVRVWPADYVNGALILDADETIRRSTGPEPWPLEPSQVEILPGRKAKIEEYVAKNNCLVLGVSNQSTHEKKEYKTPLSVIDACFSKTNELLGMDIEWFYCPHYRFPVACYCRKPHVGLAALVIKKYKLLPSKCLMVGDSTSDRTFASRAGFNFAHTDEFFSN